MTKEKLLLVGGCGFIGHNLALSLKNQGYEVAVADSLMINNIYSHQHSQPSQTQKLYLKFLKQRIDLLKQNDIKLHVVDARKREALKQVFDEERPRRIVHFAAVSHANKSNKDPHTTFDHSFITLENSLELARQYSDHFIFFSSSMVYGEFNDDFVTEESTCNPLGIYGALKYGGEKLVIAYSQVFDLDYTIIRPSALYGPRCVSRRVGQIFIENAAWGLPISVIGEGDERLDFTYIGDIVQGVMKVIQFDASRNEVFNITYGRSQALSDMVAILMEEFPEVDVEYKERDRLMPKRGTLSVEKAKRLLGYSPEYDLEKGFREYINWYRAWIPGA
jgi:nucleoside-diphosphate-sugar epimerase